MSVQFRTKNGKIAEIDKDGNVRNFKKNVPTISFKPYLSKSGRFIGGNYDLNVDGQEVGHASAYFERKGRVWPFGEFVPMGTVVIDSIEIYDERFRGMSLGTYLLKRIESDAKRESMERLWATSVMGDAESWWEKQGFRYTHVKRIWEKQL